MQPTERFYQADPYRTEAGSVILAAEPAEGGGGRIALVHEALQRVSARGHAARDESHPGLSVYPEHEARSEILRTYAPGRI